MNSVLRRELKLTKSRDLRSLIEPVHRGEEVSDNAMNWPGCRVYEAKDYLLHVQSALLAAVLVYE